MHRHEARAGAERRPQRADAERADACERVAVRRIAGEQLVAAVAGQAHRDMTARELGDVKRRDRRCVGERLVVVIRERFGHAHAVRRHDLLVVIRAEERRRLARSVELVVLRISKPDREGLHRA